MLTKFLFFFLSFLTLAGLIAPRAFSQDELSPDTDITLFHLPAKIMDALPHLFIRENVGPFVAGTFLTTEDWILWDSNSQLPSRLQQLNIQPLWDFGNFYGEGWVEGFGAVGSWSLGALTNNAKLAQFGRDASESFLLATVVVTGLKYTTGRERPDNSNDQSFPSGHTITAFSFAPVVTRYWGWGAGAAAYGLGVVTAFARVEGYHHYFSDTVAGATLGILIGQMVVYHPKDISLGLGPGTANIQLAFN